MKILSYEEREDGMLEIVTDFAPMPLFVYQADKFNNLESLEHEIQKKILWYEKHNAKKQSKKTKLLKELKAKVKKKNA